MTIDKFSSNSSSFHEIPQASGGHSKDEEDFSRVVLIDFVCKYPEFEDELRQMYWSRVRAAENRGLPIDVVEIQKDISREMGQIAPDLLAAREERLALIRNPETRASAPKLRQFERDYAASLDQVDAARSKADAARAGADAARAGAADAWARADALEVQVAEMRRRKKEAEEAENEKKKAKPVSSFREFVGKTFRQIATFFRKFFGRS